MKTNASRVFCIWMAVFLLIVGIHACYDKSNDGNPFAADQKLLVTEIPNTDAWNNDSYSSERLIMDTESLLSYMPIFCKTNTSRSWSMDLMTFCVIDLILILKNQLHFFKRDTHSVRFLPYFLLQLQIVHKSDGKYR